MDISKFLNNAGTALMNVFKPVNSPDILPEVYQSINSAFQNFQNNPTKKLPIIPPPNANIGQTHQNFLDYVSAKYFKPTLPNIGQDLSNFYQSSIKPALDLAASQPLINAPGIGVNSQLPFKSPTLGDAANFVRSSTIQPLARIGAEGVMTLTGDNNEYKPQTGAQKFLYGNEPLQNYNDPARPSRVFLKDLGIDQKYAPLLIGAGLVTDVAGNMLPGEGAAEETAGKTIAGQFNKRNLQLTEDGAKVLDQVIQEAKPKLEQTLGKTLSNNEVIQTADQTSQILSKTIGRDETKAWETAMFKARQKLTSAANNGTIDKDFLDTYMTVKSQGTDIARKLQSLSISADPKLNTMKNTILEAVLNTTNDANQILDAAKGVDFNDTNQATEFLRNFVKPRAEEWLDKVRYSSMLSSPITHVVNATSNAFNTAILTPVEKTVTGGLDWLSSGISGKPRQYAMGEGVDYAKGYYSNLKNAAVKFSNVLSGKDLSNMQEIYELPLTKQGTLARLGENVVSIPARLLQANDEFFQTLTESGINKAIEGRANAGINVTGDIKNQAYNEARKRLFNSDLGKDSSHVLQAIEYIPQKVNEARNSSNPVIRTLAKFSFPFVKVPTNVFKQSIEYSPLGLSTLWGSQTKTEQLSKAIIGSSIGTAFAMLVSSDRLTWSQPTGTKEKAAYTAAGLQPYSVKVGDKWISYSNLPPAIAFPLALVAALKKSNDEKRLSDSQVDTVLNGLADWTQFYADRSYIKNVSDLVAATKGDTQGMARFGGNYVQQTIPFRALMGWVERIVDPVQRQADPKGDILQKQLQQIMAQIPGLAQNVPTKNDQFGDPIPNQNRLINAVSPARVTTEDPLNKSLYDQMIQAKKMNQQLNDLKSGSTNVDDLQALNIQDHKPTGNSILDMFNQEQADSQRTAKIKEIFGMNLPQQKTEQLLNNYNLGSYQDGIYTVLKSLDTDHRAQVFANMSNGASDEDFVKLSQELADKGILTTSVITNLVQSGTITKDQAKYINEIIKPKVVKTGKRIKLGKPTLSHTTLHAPKVPKISTKITAVKNIKPLKPGKLGKITSIASAYKKGNQGLI